MSSAYRSAYQQIVGARLAGTKRAREMLLPLLPQVRSVRAARLARLLAGSVGLGAALLVILFAARNDPGSATEALIGGALAIPLTYLVARAGLGVLRLFAKRPAWALPKLVGQLDVDLARIDASSPLGAELPSRRLEAWSSALPLAALSLLLPLTLHFLFCLTTGLESARSFGSWILISMIIVGHAHLTLMALAIAFARKMARLDDDRLAALPIHREWAKALGITVAVSAVPGVILLAVPPVLTAITGLAFIPFMFVLMRRRVLAERATMALAEAANTIRVDVTSADEALDEATWLDVDIDAETEHQAVARM